MTAQDLPHLNAALNLIAATFLVMGFINIKKGSQAIHKRWMLAALTASALFLISYLIYHAEVGSVPYPYYDWSRPVYFAILIPHVLLAALMVPFILAMVWWALRDRFEKHRRLARWVWPIWVYVSISGVTVYLMLYVR